MRSGAEFRTVEEECDQIVSMDCFAESSLLSTTSPNSFKCPAFRPFPLSSQRTPRVLCLQLSPSSQTTSVDTNNDNDCLLVFYHSHCYSLQAPFLQTTMAKLQDGVYEITSALEKRLVITRPLAEDLSLRPKPVLALPKDEERPQATVRPPLLSPSLSILASDAD